MTDIWVPIVASVISGILGIAASPMVFRMEQRRSEEASRHDVKRAVVSRMLDVLDEALKVQTLPPIIRRLRNPQAGVALALSRLMPDLPQEESPIPLWTGSQVQRMTYERAGKRYLGRATHLQSRLLMWYRGDISSQWFSKELEREPSPDNWKPSLRLRVKTEVSDFAENFGTLAAATMVYAVAKESLLPFASRLVRDHTRK